MECLGDNRVLTYGDDLKIAVLELLQNAADAVIEAGVDVTHAVSVRVAPHGAPRGVRIDVEDRGRGFSPEALDSMFKPGTSFWTLDSNRHRGMGLYVARRMMHSIGGSLEVRPAEPNGTVARLLVRDWSTV